MQGGPSDTPPPPETLTVADRPFASRGSPRQAWHALSWLRHLSMAKAGDEQKGSDRLVRNRSSPSESSRYISAPSAKGPVDTIDDAPALPSLALSIVYRQSPTGTVSKRWYHVSGMIDLDSLKAVSRRPGRSAGQADVAQTAKPDDVDSIDWDRLKLRTA